MKNPNVIVIVTDDQGYGDVACHGNPWIETPHIDAMCNNSVELSDFHTEPMCAPTRAALLTGQYSMRAGVWSTLNGRYYLSTEYKTMAEYFQESGYHTGLFGKWHMGDTCPYRAIDRGFNHVVSFGGGVIGETPDYWNNDYFDDSYFVNGVPTRFQGYCTDVWFQQAIDFIEQSHNKPFFCYLATNAPHTPYNVDKQYYEPYMQLGLSEQVSRFYGMITNIDENMGRLQEKLATLHTLENTIIIFMGDNGSSGVVTNTQGFCTEGFNAGMRGKKGQVYEGSHKNNCFMQWLGGGFGKTRTVSGLTSVMDLLPTLIDCCKLDTDNTQFDGLNLYPSLVREITSVNPNRKLIIHCMQEDLPKKYKDFTLLDGNKRFIKTLIDGSEQMMFFDMETDFSQTTNSIATHLQEAYTYIQLYEMWWNDVTLYQQYPVAHIEVGNNAEEVAITCHAWRGNHHLAYDQVHIRQGIEGSGYWDISVEKSGTYQIELARWPKESGLALSKEAVPIPATERTHERPKGKSFDMCGAFLQMQGVQHMKTLEGDEKVASFEVSLIQGKTTLQTWFLCFSGELIGSYYVYIRKLKEVSCHAKAKYLNCYDRPTEG